MPSFLEGLMRVIQGKPVFNPSEEAKIRPTNPADTQAQAQPVAPQVARGPKQLPVVHIERWDVRETGNQMQCDIFIKNFSSKVMELDTFEFMGQRRDLGTSLRPGESREFRVYSGPRPSNQNYNQCKVFYRDPSGDYFNTVHDVDFEQQPDGTFTVLRFTFLPPVRDV